MKKMSIVLAAILFFIFTVYGCKTTTSDQETQKVGKNIRKDLAELDKGYGFIPYYEAGSLAFSNKDAILKMKERKKIELLRAKQRFRRQAEGDRFRGIKNVYWIPPPENPKLYLALKVFPKDAFGYPDWTTAVRKRVIAPLDSLGKKKIKAEVYNKSIIFKINDRMMANVRFPHKIHNYWLSCKICHPGIFIAKKGANDFGMTDIWNGRYCGRCHGRVAFQPKGFENCVRCHSVKREKVVF